MAPEQFGRDFASPATDVYAAGILLYEMICGRLPFTGRTVEEIKEQKLLNQAVPIRQSAPGISNRWESAIYRAIHSDPEKRFASAAEFLAAIRPRRRTVYKWTIAAAILVAAVSSVLLWTRSNRPVNAPLASHKLTSDSGYSMEPTISADGQFVVYTSDRGATCVRSLWKMRIGDNKPVQVTFDDLDTHQPHLSPDSLQVVFRSEREGGGLYIAPVDDGRNSRRIVKGGARPRFSPDGKWVLFMAVPATASQLPQVYAVRAEGGNPVHVSAGFADAHNPIWSEDGRFVLFCGTKTPGVPAEEHDWWIIPFQTGGVPRKTGVLPALAKLAASTPANRINEDIWEWKNDYVYYASPMADSSSIWRIRLSPYTRDAIQPPERLTYGTGLDTQPSIGGGKIVFASSVTNIDVWTLPLDANAGIPMSPPARVTDNTDYEVSSSADPTGRYLVFTKALGSQRELRMLDWQADRDSVPWSAPAETADHPLWSRDGEWVAYRVYDRPKLRIFMKSPKSRENRLICPDCGSPTDWSPDQKHILYEPGTTIAYIGRLTVATGETREWIQHPRQSLRYGRYSPDGNWIAFQAETSRTDRRVFIAPNSPQDSERLWIPIGESNMESPVDILPSWSPDGNLLYFLSNRDGFRCIFAQRLDPRTKRPVGDAFEVQHFHRSRRSLLRIVTARAPQIGFRVYKDRAFFSMDEVTGNLWAAELPR
jgi:eukaryotic-like serine/threonine-protein kinase